MKEYKKGNSTSSRSEEISGHEKAALERFKMEVAEEIGVPLRKKENKEINYGTNNSIGEEMVRQMKKGAKEKK